MRDKILAHIRCSFKLQGKQRTRARSGTRVFRDADGGRVGILMDSEDK